MQVLRLSPVVALKPAYIQRLTPPFIRYNAVPPQALGPPGLSSDADCVKYLDHSPKNHHPACFPHLPPPSPRVLGTHILSINTLSILRCTGFADPLFRSRARLI